MFAASVNIASHPNASAVGQQTTAPLTPGAEWLRPADIRPLYGIGRSLLYELIKSGDVHSVCLRRKGKATGCRLVSAESLRAFIAKHEKDAAMNREIKQATDAAT